MGWRDRVKNSSAYSADIAEGVQNSKNDEKERKEVFKTTITPYTHITQNTQIRPKQEEKEDSSVWVDSSEPRPEPRQTVQDQYEIIWARAWNLADKIDDHQSGVDVEIRRRMMPELNRMRAELSHLEQAGAKPPTKGLNQ